MANKKNGLLVSILAFCVAAGCAEGSHEETTTNDEVCQSGTKKCDGKDIKICKDDKWVVEKTCSELCITTGNQVSCKDTQTSCENGNYKCDNNSLMFCENSKWNTKQACSETQTCNATKEQCDEQITIVCNEGRKGCSGNTPRTCHNNAWIDETACGEGKICIGESGSCEDAKCSSGAARCDGNKLIICDQNSQEKTIDCDKNETCNKDLGKCEKKTAAQCDVSGTKIAHGASLCIGGKLISCDDGEPDSIDCEDGEICHNGDNKCEPPRSCSLDGKTLANGQSACDTNKDVNTCNDGILKVTKDCADNQVCVDNNGVFSCQNPPEVSCELGGTTIEVNKKICVGNKLHTCVQDGDKAKLDDGVTCGDGKSLCEKGACVAAPCGSVANGQQTCNDEGTQIATCTDGDLINISGSNACTADQKCSLNGTKPECIDIKTIPVYETITSIHNDYASIIPAECEGKNGNLIEADVQIEGVVTGKLPNSTTDPTPKGIFIQDPSITDGKYAGLFVFCNSGKSNCPAYDVSIGDNVKVVSNGIGHLNCQLQIRAKTKTTITKTSKKEKISATPVEVADVNSGKHGDYNGTLVKLSHVNAVESITSPKGWYVADDNGKRVLISNRLSKVQDLFQENSEYFVTGIVDYNTGVTQVMPRIVTDVDEIQCTGTETKCDLDADNSDKPTIYTCEGIKWKLDHACSGNVTNGAIACKNNACGIECKDGYKEQDGNCVPKTATLKDCEDYNHNSVADSKFGCTSPTAFSVCDDGKWGSPQNCSGPANSTVSCNSGQCSYKCNDGYTPTGDKCIEKSCSDTYTNHDHTPIEIDPGSQGCKSKDTYATCSKGEWVGGTKCVIENSKDSRCQVVDKTPECYVYACENGFERSADRKSCIPKDKSCEGVNNGQPVSIANEQLGCKSDTILALCNNKEWISDEDCSTKYEHGTGKCNNASCILVSCEDNYTKNADSTACIKKQISCEDAYHNQVSSGSDGCNTASTLATCNNGSWNTASAIQCVSLFDNAQSAECQGDTCSVVDCINGYEPNAANSACVKKHNCFDYLNNRIDNDDFGCKTENISAACIEDEWSTDPEFSSTCPNGCDASTGECRTATPTDTEIEACVFQYLDASYSKMAYGRVYMRKSKDNYVGQLVCINSTAPSTIIRVPATYNKTYDAVNAEFMAPVDNVLGAPSGWYKCTFEFRDIASDTWYACGTNDNINNKWRDPIKVENNEATLSEDWWYLWMEAFGILTVVERPDVYTTPFGKSSNPGYASEATNTFRTKTIASPDGAINIGPWPTATAPDFSKNYVKLTLTAEQIALLQGKSQLTTSFQYKVSDTSKGARHIAAAYFNGDTMVGTASSFDTSAAKATAQFTTNISNPENLQLRIVGYDSISATAGTIYIYPIEVIAE